MKRNLLATMATIFCFSACAKHNSVSNLTPNVWETKGPENISLVKSLQILPLGLDEVLVLQEVNDKTYGVTWNQSSKFTTIPLEETSAQKFAYDSRRAKLYILSQKDIASYRLNKKGRVFEYRLLRNPDTQLRSSAFSLIRNEVWVLTDQGFEVLKPKAKKIEPLSLQEEVKKELATCDAKDMQIANDGARIYMLCDSLRQFWVFNIADKKIVKKIPIPAENSEESLVGFGYKKGEWIVFSMNSRHFYAIDSQTLRAAKKLESSVTFPPNTMALGIWENSLFIVKQEGESQQSLLKSKF